MGLAWYWWAYGALGFVTSLMAANAAGQSDPHKSGVGYNFAVVMFAIVCALFWPLTFAFGAGALLGRGDR